MYMYIHVISSRVHSHLTQFHFTLPHLRTHPPPLPHPHPLPIPPHLTPSPPPLPSLPPPSPADHTTPGLQHHAAAQRAPRSAPRYEGTPRPPQRSQLQYPLLLAGQIPRTNSRRKTTATAAATDQRERPNPSLLLTVLAGYSPGSTPC